METDKQIQILLSTYNGEKYLAKQLNSIVSLDDFALCSVLIRDDGSIDGTIDILHNYEKYPQFRIVYGSNIGITDSYFWLITHADPCCSYYAFSDQDDIWLPDKLIRAKRELAQHSENEALLFASLSRIIDENDCFLYDLPVPRKGISYYNAMIQNVLPGHTQVLNRKMRELIIERGIENVHVIDWWYYLAASSVGTVVFLPEYTVLHRQHGGNAVGVSETRLQNISRRLRYIREGRGNAFSKQLCSFYDRYQDILPEEYRKETERFLNSLPSVGSRLRYALSCRAFRQKKKEDLLFRLLYVLGKYKL